MSLTIRLCSCLVMFVLSTMVVLHAADEYFVYVSGTQSEIHCFTYNQATGELTPASISDGGKNPGFMAFAPDHRTAYATNVGADSGMVWAWRINEKNGALTKLSAENTGGKGPCHVSVHPSGKWVYAAHYGSGHLSVLPVLADGVLVKASQVIMAGTKAHMAITDAAGGFLFVPTLGLDQVQIFRIDNTTGQVTPHNPPNVAVPPQSGPRHMAFHPDGKHAYVIGELGWTLTSFDYDPATAVFANPHTVPTMGDYQGKGTCAHVMVSPDGQFVYGSNRGMNTIVICKVEQKNGQLQVLAHESGDGEIQTPRNFNISPDGRFMLVASQGADYVTVFEINKETGMLTKKHTVKTCPKPTFVGFVPRE